MPSPNETPYRPVCGIESPCKTSGDPAPSGRVAPDQRGDHLLSARLIHASHLHDESRDPRTYRAQNGKCGDPLSENSAAKNGMSQNVMIIS